MARRFIAPNNAATIATAGPPHNSSTLAKVSGVLTYINTISNPVSELIDLARNPHSVTVGATGRVTGGVGVEYNAGYYFSWDWSKRTFDVGHFKTIGLTWGVDSGVSATFGLYNGMDVTGRSVSLNGGAGFLGGSLVFDGDGNVLGRSGSLSFGLPYSGSITAPQATEKYSYKNGGDPIFEHFP